MDAANPSYALISATFLKGFLHCITQQQWNGSALVYVTYALSQIKQTPVWGSSALNDIG